MIRHEDIKHFLDKNVSYLFTISLFNHALTGELRKYIINTYFYYENEKEEDILYILLNLDSEEMVENNKFKIIGYISHEICCDFILLRCKLSEYLEEEEIYYIESSHYTALKDTNLFKKYLVKQGDTRDIKDNDIEEKRGMDLQRQIILNTAYLKEVWKTYLKSFVNEPWTKYDIRKETLTLEKLINMNTQLNINKHWLLTKIENASLIAKIAYEDVLDNATEITAPSVIALGQNSINYDDIYNKVKEALIKKCGKPQFNIDIHGTKYPLMCNSVDFKTKLSKVIKKYKLEDINKITNILIDHVIKLKAPLLKYYIEKDNNSSLAGDYENYISKEPIVNTQSFEI